MARALPEDGRLLIDRDRGEARRVRATLHGARRAARSRRYSRRPRPRHPAELDGERFDAVFLDADKEPMPTYFEWALRLLRPGGLMIADNALWGGKVFDDAEHGREDDGRAGSSTAAWPPTRAILSILVPTHDGVAIGVVKDRPSSLNCTTQQLPRLRSSLASCAPLVCTAMTVVLRAAMDQGSLPCSDSCARSRPTLPSSPMRRAGARASSHRTPAPATRRR